MKKTHILILLLALMPFTLFAGKGPGNIGAVKIGMSKAKYISTIGISPINCNTHKNETGELSRFEKTHLRPDKKTLCWSFLFRKTGSVESIKVGGISYDVIEANYRSSKLIQSFGINSKALFLRDKLISLEITFPEVSLDTLGVKYGEPKFLDKRKVNVCKNRMGNTFNNNIGELDAIWVNGKVHSILRSTTTPPNKTCTDNTTMKYYVLEIPSKVKLIEDAINQYNSEISKKKSEDSPF